MIICIRVSQIALIPLTFLSQWWYSVYYLCMHVTKSVKWKVMQIFIILKNVLAGFERSDMDPATRGRCVAHSAQPSWLWAEGHRPQNSYTCMGPNLHGRWPPSSHLPLSTCSCVSWRAKCERQKENFPTELLIYHPPNLWRHVAAGQSQQASHADGDRPAEEAPEVPPPHAARYLRARLPATGHHIHPAAAVLQDADQALGGQEGLLHKGAPI